MLPSFFRPFQATPAARGGPPSKMNGARKLFAPGAPMLVSRRLRARRPVAFRKPSPYAGSEMLRIIDAKDPDYSARLRPLCERSAETPPSIEAAARDVIHQVRRRGDAAVRELTEKFEQRALDALELPRAAWLEQASHVAPGVRLPIEPAAVP